MTSMGIQSVSAATGDVLADFPAAPTTGNGRGMAVNDNTGNVYYTIVGDSNIYEMTAAGGVVGTISVPGGDPRVASAGPLTYDGNNLWTVDYSGALIMYQVNPVTGATVSQCDIAAVNPGHASLTDLTFPDRLDWTGNQLILSGEISLAQPGGTTSIVRMNPDCTITSFFSSPAPDNDGQWSGVAATGTTLWHADPLIPQMEQTTLGGIVTGVNFPNNGLGAGDGHEDMEYDPKNFAPLCAVWANEATFAVNTLRAYEIPCTFPAGVGGEYLTMDSTALFMAGATTNAMWILPMLAGIAGVGAYFTRNFWHKV